MREECVERREAVVPGGEFELDRVGAALDEREDRLMLGDRLPRPPRHEAERRLAQRPQARPTAIDELPDVRVGAVLEEHGVKVQVEPGERHGVEVVKAFGERVVDRPRTGHVIRGHERCGCRGRPAFDETQCLHGHLVFARVDHGDLGADVALEVHEPLGFEPADRLAYGHDAHAELSGDRSEDEPVARRVARVLDACLDEVVGELRLALRRCGGRYCAASHVSYLDFHSAFRG